MNTQSLNVTDSVKSSSSTATCVKSSSTMVTSTTTMLMNPPVQDISVQPNAEGAGTYIARLILKIQKSLEQLGVIVSDDDNDDSEETDRIISKMESMSIFIHESMSIGSRNYHSVQHVFDILSSSTDEVFRNDPIATLAGIFHDCVYYNIDGGFSKSQAEKLHGAYVLIEPEPGSGGTTKLQIHPDSDNDPLISMVLQIYGFEPGQDLNPMGGQNEYLSAVIAVRELAELNLSPSILAQIAVCIEATIPFRPTKDTVSPMDRLYNNLQEAVIRFGLQMSDVEVVAAVQRAVLLTNEDVANFASDDQSWFLDNTWSLLPESNVALRQQNLYTIGEFQFAVFKMYGFFSFLQPTVIFQKFQGIPSDEEWELRTSLAATNLQIGKKYIAAKLVSMTVLAALAELTGGDAPISLFVGDLPTRQRISQRLEDSLEIPLSNSIKVTDPGQSISNGSSKGGIKLRTTSTRTSIILQQDDKNALRSSIAASVQYCPDHCNPIVYKLLAEGRSRESSFDVKQSPLAAYYYWHLGDTGIEQLFATMKGVPVYPMNTPDKAKQFLLLLPPDAVKYVAEKVAVLAISRTNRIHQVIADLYK